MNAGKTDKSALSVTPGIEQPKPVNGEAVTRLKNSKKKQLSSEEYYQGIINGSRIVLSQAITLIESSLPAHQEIANDLIGRCLPHSGRSIRIGITGVPGVGKSSFIECFGKYLTSTGRKPAILAIDPSSERSGGSILGDKTRMEHLATDPAAFIRPSPAGGSLGGVARKTRESIILCEAAGFDTIIVETVGVGQSETAVHSMVDFFLLLMLAGAGDELQGIKRGIMEMADAIAINKADGSNIDKATLARSQYESALHLFPPSPSSWVPQVLTCSAHTKNGIDKIWQLILEYEKLTVHNGFFMHRRNEQSKYWMYETINERLKKHFFKDEAIKPLMKTLENEVLANKKSPFSAATELLNAYFRGRT